MQAFQALIQPVHSLRTLFTPVIAEPELRTYDNPYRRTEVIDDKCREMPAAYGKLHLLQHFRLLAEDIRVLKSRQDAILSDFQAYVESTYTGLVERVKTLYSPDVGVYDWSVFEPIEKNGVVVWFDRNNKQLRCIVENVSIVF